MSKTLFYLGVLFSALLAVGAAVQAATMLIDFRAADGSGLWMRGLRVGALLILSMPVAALFVRMSSLLAARNLFSALFSLIAVCSTSLSVILLAAVELRLLQILRLAEPDPRVALLLEVRGVIVVAAGFFLAMTLTALAPWFRIQAHGLLSSLLYTPAFLFGWLVIEQNVLTPALPGAALAPTPGVFAYFSCVALVFWSISIHSLRHRHLFLEPTNLRELLDGRFAGVHERKPFGFGNKVAFDN